MNSNKLRWFSMGLVVCLVGAGLIWIGDGSDHFFRKGVVIAGVTASVVGIGLLRFLLFAKRN